MALPIPRSRPPGLPPRVVVALLPMALFACARRETPDERMPVAPASVEDWAYATHPAITLPGEELRALAVHALELSARFSLVNGKGGPGTLTGRLSLRILDAQVTPAGKGDEVVANVRARLELLAPLAEEPTVAVVSGQARGTRDVASRGAVQVALARGLDESAMALAARSKADEELVAELASADRARARVALDRLALRRHVAAYEPLVTLLRGPDAEEAQRALAALVMLDDVRMVRPVIDESEKRDLSFLLEAIYALGSIGGEDAEAYLFTLTSGHPDRRVQAAAAEALTFAHRRHAPVPGNP